ncbi:MAG: hypothetical protein M3R38_23850 [Actinomycetota bacterium]|nr:hypothetical protein [Actinomycetota bacterium]
MLACTLGALAQPGGAALGTQAGEAQLRDVLHADDFSSAYRVAHTPLNLVLEARPSCRRRCRTLSRPVEK